MQVVDRGTATRSAWDGDALRMTFDGSNALQRWESTDLFGELIAVHDATTGQSEDVLANHLGSNQDVPRDSFGNPLVVSTAFAPHALTWHTQDPTGLIFARARYLDPKTGRFLSEDPILSTNRYLYALNNPLVMWDPYGLTAATEHQTLRKGVTDSSDALDEVGQNTACVLEADAAAVALSAMGVQIAVSGCGASGDYQYTPDRTLPTDKQGVPVPDSPYPHSQLGRSKPKYGSEPQAREWHYGNNGNLQPRRDIDFTDHRSPEIHTMPHQHRFTPNNPKLAPRGGFHRGPAEPL